MMHGELTALAQRVNHMFTYVLITSSLYIIYTIIQQIFIDHITIRIIEHKLYLSTWWPMTFTSILRSIGIAFIKTILLIGTIVTVLIILAAIYLILNKAINR